MKITDRKFKLVSPFKPTGDQPQAIKKITANLNAGQNQQVLLGVTGSGKTFTMANIVQEMQKPTIVLAHNKTLAAQLTSEFREFFPENAVNYFVSYYDYYQPEAYMPHTDTYIEKDASINEEIDKYRHAATKDLLTRNDVLIVASVSCIYGLGDVEEYANFSILIEQGKQMKRDKLLRHFTDLQYNRNDMNFKRGTFRVRGDVVEIQPSYSDTGFRIEFFGDEIEAIQETDPLTGELIQELKAVEIYPAKHSITSKERILKAVEGIRKELDERTEQLEKIGKIVESKRLRQRTEYDIEMLLETGYCTGIENYVKYFASGDREQPATLLDYFPDDYLMFIDESHITVSQIGGMYNGNYSRKTTLVEHGFRLPSSHNNRPLKYEEFHDHINQVVYVSATPREYEIKQAGGEVVEQLIRPTGLIDPEISVRPTKNQIDDLLNEIKIRTQRGERTLVTTLTKRMSEDLTDYMKDAGIKVQYLHSEVDTMERIDILRDLRLGTYDVLIGINLLREGLDLPEVSLVAILDADKEGFLRSTMALVQTIGRASRNVKGQVIMYADRITDSMKGAIDETNRRRKKQIAYNKKHNITPQSIIKEIRDIGGKEASKVHEHFDATKMPKDEIKQLMKQLEIQMDAAAANMEFEKAADLRDQIEELMGF